MTTIRLPNNWNPREDQLPLWKYLEKGGKRGVEVAHRRWGKDDVALHFTATAMHKRIGNYWHMLPKYEQARKVIWTSINPRTGKLRIDEAFPVEIRAKTNQQEMKIDLLCGSSWQLVGSDNYNSIVGPSPVGISFSEWALANPMAWAYLSPILDENGGWALFISTSRGRNHLQTLLEYAKRTPGWFAGVHKASETEVFSKEQLDEIKANYIGLFGEDLGLALYLQEYECSFEGAVLGSYYGKQMAAARAEGRICAVPWQPQAEIDTYWDLGLDDSMSLWFIQHIGKAHHVIDYLEGTGNGLEWYANQMREGHRRGYKYGNHYMPHDAEVREMTSGEIARSRREVAESLGISPVVVVPRAQNMDIIVNVHLSAVRNILPSCWFDEKKCSVGISALENYHAKYDEEKKVLLKRPEHDHNSHGADAFRTFAVGYQEPVKVASVTDYLNRRVSIKEI